MAGRQLNVKGRGKGDKKKTEFNFTQNKRK